MASRLVLKDKCIFHLTHISNIPSILVHGIACKNATISRKIKHFNVAHENIQDVRAHKMLPNTNYTLHDCVPMFFGARPPMLRAVMGKGVSQEEMVYALVDWDIIGKDDVWFTDGNARSETTTFYHDPDDLIYIDLEAAAAVWWHNEGDNFRRKKQAEVLQLNRVDIDDILGFVVYNKKAKEKLNTLLTSQGISKKVFVVPEYYY
jgi:hypothetical protein